MKRFTTAMTAIILVSLIGIVGCEPEDTARTDDPITTDNAVTTGDSAITDDAATTDDPIKPGDIAEGDVATAEKVTVRGEVERQVDQRSFAMSGDWEFFSDDLVVITQGDLPVIADGDEVEVTGTVRNVGLVEIAEETNWKFNPQVRIELEDVTGYLVADSVRVVERD